MISNTLTLSYQDVYQISSTPVRHPIKGWKIFIKDSSQVASSTKVKVNGWNEVVPLAILNDLENSFSNENINFVPDLTFNLELLTSLAESEIFSQEMDPEFSRILAKHNLKGKKKRTRW